MERSAPRVGLVATLLSTAASYRGAGIHHYSAHLLNALCAVSTPRPLRYLAYVGDPAYQAPPGLALMRAPALTQKPTVRILWEQCVLPWQARFDRVSLLHGLAYALPLAWSGPAVVTVHDLSFLLFPRSFAAANRLYLSRITAISCRRARRVIAVSQATAHDLTRLLGISPRRIDVIYNGVDSVFFVRDPEAVAAFRRQAGWPEQFILSLGTLEPRKNYGVLIEAYALYRQMSARPLPLLIAGGRGWDYEAIFTRVAQLDLTPHVVFLGFVPAATLPWLYNAATLFVYPSRYEGFGLPVVEAMACGVPVITTRASSLPEVAGTAAWLLDPDDSEGLAQAMHVLTTDAGRREAMRQAGLEQARRFRWTETAAATAATYARVLAS
jgi:glycosyltransferase involved in cell wall biosynthesis